MLAVARKYGSKVFNPAQLNALAAANQELCDEFLAECLSELRTDYVDFGASTGSTVDKIAKGPAFVGFVLDRAFPADEPVEEAQS